ncbi:MAG TPA: SDR family NAD(P)-dependent oxidoreductase [Stellaceae bacterium]|nr:SDR family NAD(P)-dependent oxidoreductase [Stellaceae bacterium]
MNAYDLSGKNAIITGGAGGIGRAVARLMLASSARVSLWDNASAGLDAAARALGDGADGRFTTRLVDITDADAVSAAVAAEQAHWGRVDILVNNAGILGEVKPISDTDPADFRRVLEVNLVGAYLCTRAVLPVLRAQTPRPHRGHIVNVASIQGKEGMPLATAYSASKAGLIALTKSAGKEVAGDGILVNCIAPAAAETAMAKLLTPERRADILNRIPMRRFVEVGEIARMVAWLASDECSFSTGAVFDLSGGRATY